MLLALDPEKGTIASGAPRALPYGVLQRLIEVDSYAGDSEALLLSADRSFLT
jgi:hypothetical protein